MATEEEKTGNIFQRSRLTKPASGDLSNFVFGKVQPQARDLEEAVLGALMLEKDPVALVIDMLKPESFYVEAHQHIFRAIVNLFNHSQPIDILTVTDELRSMGKLDICGGPFFITDLTNRVTSAANVEYHSRIIAQKYVQRELIKISSDIIKQAYEDTTDVFELLDSAEKNIYDVTEKNLRKNYKPIGSLVSTSMKKLDQMRHHLDGISPDAVPSGFTGLDRLTSGWQKSDLIIVAARPGMGKTAFTLALARNAAIDHKKPVAFFSLEMSSIQLTNRLISSETLLPGDKIRRGNLLDYEWTQLTSKVGELSNAPIYIDDTPAINIFELRAKCRRLKMQYDIQMVVIDYLQLMSGGNSDNKGGNREQEISTISRSLKSIAKELEIPVIALSQLNRAVETRSGTSKKPQLSDLRESGAIEQDADMVIFLYRPEYYGFTEDADHNSTKDMAQIILAKHRNGALGDINVKFIKDFAKFEDYVEDIQNLRPLNRDFTQNNEGNIIVRQSKMNELPDDQTDDEPY